jgi:hypothetical protein
MVSTQRLPAECLNETIDAKSRDVVRSKTAITKVIAAGIFAVLILSGGAAIYYYTSPQLGPGGASTISSSAASSGTGSSLGYQDSNGRPLGTWSRYLGYIPQGYVAAPHQSNAPNFPCPPDMTPSACAVFKQTCGNGVCDPNETCSSCAIDCAPTGNLVCDPYTGRPGQPSSICQGAVVGA